MAAKDFLLREPGRGWGARIIAIILAIIASWLIVGGGWLVAIGGSPYYVLAGVLCGAATYLYAANRRGALLTYLVLVIGTYLWAFAETGSDVWRLVPRVTAPSVLAVILLVHAVWAGPADRRKSIFFTCGAIFLFGSVLLVARYMPATTGGMGEVPATTVGVIDDWPTFGGAAGAARFSPAAQITPANVGRLERAWTLRVGELGLRPGETGAREFEVTPIKIGDLLYVCTPHNVVIAIDADTGKERWRFDPKINGKGVVMFACRGVAHYAAPTATNTCQSRILFATLDARMFALDAQTGRRCSDFGSHGEISLLDQMGLKDPGLYYVTSPPTIVAGTAVVGGWVRDGRALDEPAGVIRGFDAITGKLRWAWDPGAKDENAAPAPGATYTLGSPNSWSVASVDETLGLVYLPMGNATPDYVGRHRSPEDNRYSTSVVALDGRTGQRRWSFQTVHNDLWDYDLGSQPVLFDLPMRDGSSVPALAQPTKQGDIYILDRRTGKPLTDVVERKVPQGTTPGERYSPTQPYSVGFPTFTPPSLRESDMWGMTPLDQLWCRIRFHSVDHRGKFTPPSFQGTINYPGNMGAIDWGSVSIDEKRSLMVVNSTYMPNITSLFTRAQADKVGERPLTSHEAYAPQRGTPYAASAVQFQSPLGVPCHAPPWGKLTAVDLKTRKILWQRPLGTSRDHAPMGIAVPGIFNLGGSVATAGGVTFIGATIDHYFRAFDTSTGEELWRDRLPAGGQAGPMSYVSRRTGRQYVVIAAGGHALLQSGSSDSIVAYALSDKAAK